MNNEMWLYLIGQIITAAGLYTAIRVDLKGHEVRLGLIEKQQEKLEDKLQEARKCPV